MTRTGFNWTLEHPRLAADVSGDGRADIIGFGPDGVWCGLNVGDGTFREPTLVIPDLGYNDGWRIGDDQRLAADLTGDGRADIIGFGAVGTWIALNDGNASFRPLQLFPEFGRDKGWSAERHPRFLVDLTGDGRADIVGFGDAGVWTALNNGDGTFRTPQFVLADFGFDKGWRVDRHPRFLVDLTGDGRADIIGFGDAGVWTALNNGDGTFRAPQLFPEFGHDKGWSAERHPRFLVDLTGDGRADIVGFGDAGVWTALNNGDGTFRAPQFVLAEFGFDKGWRVDRHPRIVVDLTGDGRADIVGFGDAGVWTALNNGDGTFRAPQFVLAEFGFERGWRVAQHPRVMADVTGDGLPDIVAFGDDGLWRALNNGQGAFVDARFALREFGQNSNRDLIIRNDVVEGGRNPLIEHVFVLVLENRSFDHMLGFSGIEGTDAATGEPTKVDGLSGHEGNSFMGNRFPVRRGARDVMFDPRHEFDDVVKQLCGPDAAYVTGAYPPINNSGFVSAYAKSNPSDPAQVMECFTREQVPIVNALAREFLVCDRWFSSVPGPTAPNRMFIHAATSGVFDDSPELSESVTASGLPDFPVLEDIIDLGFSIFGIKTKTGGFEFKGGNIFDSLKKARVKYRIYAGDSFPDVATHDNVSIAFDIHAFEDLASDLQHPSFDASYVFIEPHYDVVRLDGEGDFSRGNSQHPRGSVAAGERLIQSTYEAIRNSPVWEKSLLIITWDEHGGFYDHVPPGPATPTGSTGRNHRFGFDQLGPRVPALVVSPLIRKNMISHLQLEHASIAQTLIDQFGLRPLSSSRVARPGVNGLGHFANLSEPRKDTPSRLQRAPSTVAPAMTPRPTLQNAVARTPQARLRDDPHGHIAMLVSNVVIQHVKLEPQKRKAIEARAHGLRTHADLLEYAKEVEALALAARANARGPARSP
jgi:phospholipase C